MKHPVLRLVMALIVSVMTHVATPASAAEKQTPFCVIKSMETDLHWTYFSLASSCFQHEKFQVRSDGNQNINLLAHLFAAHAGNLKVSVRWDVHGFGPTVLGIETRP